MIGPTEQCGHLHDVLAWILASNGLRDGSDLGLIRTLSGKLIVELG